MHDVQHVYNTWWTVRGAWCMVHGAWSAVHGAWCMILGAWCAWCVTWCQNDLRCEVCTGACCMVRVTVRNGKA